MSKLKRLITSHPVVILFLGLLMAQVIATTQVYLSNLDLYKTLTDVSSAGYLAIPNNQVMNSLREFSPAFWGGLFFTFTIGAGICLGAMAAAWIWTQVFLRKRPTLVIFQIIWVGLLILVNSNGINFISTLYFLLIAPVAFCLTAKWESITVIQSDRIRRLIHLVPLPFLALLWFTQFDNELFIDLRDNLLLSHNYGRRFSDFYYSYTLYPAEAFKALNQKTIKTGSIKNIQSRSLNKRIGQRLAANDYLPLSDAADVDLVIYQKNDRLVLQAGRREVLQIPIDQFLVDSQDVLQKFSEEYDRYAIFRQLTYLSLLIGFPVLIYMLLHAVLYYLGYLILGRSTSALTASIICLFIGVMVLVYFQSNRSRSIQIQNIPDALKSDHWQTRVAALKLVELKKLEIDSYQSYPVLLRNPNPRERYWLARTLAFSRRPETLRVLLEFLHDDNLNVRTMALNSLGLRRNPRAIRSIISIIEKSDSWYEQMYAYKALRSLGWKQTGSR